MTLLKLNLKKQEAAQDMIKLIEKEKELSVAEAINFSINSEICNRILKTGWGSIALPIWGHGDPDREWSLLDNPSVEIEISEDKAQLISKVESKEGVDTERRCEIFSVNSDLL